MIKKRYSLSFPSSSLGMHKARAKISPELFKKLNYGFVQDIYEDKEEVKLYKGFRIFGIDGSRLELPNMTIPKDKKQSEDIKEIYGQVNMP